MRVQPSLPVRLVSSGALLCSACLEPLPADQLASAPSAAASDTASEAMATAMAPPAVSGPAPTPTTAPVASTPGPAPVGTPSGVSGCPRVEIFTNGSFDGGDTGWSQGSGGWDSLIVDAATVGTPVTPHSGTHFARLGGYLRTGEEPLTGQDSLIAPITVPEGATNIVFSYYSILQSQEASAEALDTLFMSLDSDVQYVMEVLDNTSVHAEWQRFEQAIDPSAAGKSVVMLIRVENDASNPTTFLIDSMSLVANVCP